MRALPTSNLPQGLGWQTVAGQAVIDTHRQIRSVLASRLGEDHADVLAVPVRDGASMRVDWYAPERVAQAGTAAPAVRLLDLAPDARRAPAERLAAMLSAIETLGRELAGAANASEARMGERLQRACRHPGPEFVFVIGDQPVVTAWGASLTAVDQTSPALTRNTKEPLPRHYYAAAQDLLGDLPPPPPPPEPPRSPLSRLLSGETFGRVLARIGAKQGEVNVLLQWRSPADLDLSVVCPDGDRICFSNRKAGGGELDVDMNYGNNHSEAPAESIYFPAGAAKPGRYRVLVRNSSPGYGPVAFEVVTAIRGEENRVAGQAASGQGDVHVHSFVIT